MATLRLGSLNALETESKMPRRLDPLIGPRKPSPDSIGRVMEQMDPDQLRAMLGVYNHRLRRNKSLGIILGHCALSSWTATNFFPSYHRCCAQCNQRQIRVDGGERTQYYHRAVMAHLIGFDFPLILDVEMIGPHEGETTAPSAGRTIVGKLCALL